MRDFQYIYIQSLIFISFWSHKLSSSVFQLQVSDAERSCIESHFSTLAPFGDIPNRLSSLLSPSLNHFRLLLHSLDSTYDMLDGFFNVSIFVFSGRLIDILPFLDCINSSFEIERWLISGIHFLLCEIIPLLLPGATLLGILFRKYLDRSNRPPFSDIIHTILSSLVHSSALLFAVLQSALQALRLKLHFGGFFLSVRISTRTRQLDRTYR